MNERALTEGEIWTADALADLRRGDLRPTAWIGFLQSSFERSSAFRSENPVLVRQARLWAWVGGAAWLALCATTRGHSFSPRPTIGLLWWACCWAMLDLHLGMAETPEGDRRGRLSAADAVTMSRFWLVPALPAARASPPILAALIAAGGATDCLDGGLARRDGPTRLGRDLDSTADIASLVTAAWVTRSAGRLPAPVTAVLATRYVLGISLGFAAQLTGRRRPNLGARRSGGMLRVAGLALAAGGLRRAGGALLLAGSIVPPRTARHRPPPRPAADGDDAR